MTDEGRQMTVLTAVNYNGQLSTDNRRCSSGVEHFLGKEEVVSSILINGSKDLELRLFVPGQTASK
jgi:hypothetical protein